MPDNLLAERIAQPDVADLPDWRVAEVLNAPDPTAPEIVERVPILCGFSTVLELLGPEDGAVFLDELVAMSATNTAIKWALRVLESDKLDVSQNNVRMSIDWLASQGKITTAQAEAFKGLGERRRHPSWAEIHKIRVDAREVGLARGGI